MSQSPGSNLSPDEKKASPTEAGIAGASGGTLLAGLAQLLPNDNPWKPVLVLLAPGVSALLSGAWYQFR